MIYIAFAAYNEERIMPQFLEHIQAEMNRMGHDYEVIACIDASTDSTGGIIESYQSRMPITLLPYRKDRGLGRAVAHVIEDICTRAQPDDIMIFLDADMTHLLTDADAMISRIQEGYDVAIGSRFTDASSVSGFPRYRMMLSQAASIFFQYLFPIQGVKDYTSGYRAYRVRKIQEAFKYFEGKLIEERDFCCTGEMLVKLRYLGARMIDCPLTYRYDLKVGESQMRISRLIQATLRMSWRLLKLRKIK